MLFVVGMLLGSMVFPLLSGAMSADANLQLAETNPQLFRFGVFISHLLTFTLPGIVALFIVFRTTWWQRIDLHRLPISPVTGNSIIFFVISLPLVAFSAWLNLQIDLPAWAIQAEDGTTEIMKALVNFTGPASLLLTLLGTSLAAGFGEEIIFRGILQGKILDQINHHAAIWLAAIAFSAIHMELAGFLPRMLLGAVLGYTYWWTKSLWVPIILHMLFNGIQVVAIYYSGEFVADTEVQELPEWYLIIGSLALSAGMVWLMEQKTQALTDHDQQV